MNNNRTESLFFKAKKASRERLPLKAIAFYDEIIMREPHNADAYWGKCAEYIYLRYHEKNEKYINEEIACFKKLLELDKEKYYICWFDLAAAFEASGRFSEAMQCYKHFIHLCDHEDSEDLEDGARRRIFQLANSA